MPRKWYGLILCSAIALLTLIMAFLQFRDTTGVPDVPAWYIPLGILMVLVLPGYTISSALFTFMSRPARILLSLGLSITIDVIGAMMLNLTPWGLQPFTWAVFLSITTLLGCLGLAFVVTLDNDDAHSTTTIGKSSSPLFFVIAAALVFVSIFIARSISSGGSTDFTQLWATPVSDASQDAVSLGIRNLTQVEQHFSLFVEIKGIRVAEWSDIVLEPDETWTSTAPLDEKPTDTIQVSLYKLDEPGQVYRFVTLSPVAFQPNEQTPDSQ
jgi:hypothetical protein